MKIYRLTLSITVIFLFLCSCTGGNNQNEPSTVLPQSEAPLVFHDNTSTPTQHPDDGNNADDSAVPGVASGEVVITFNYEKQSGSASNQYAVWVEDMNGNYINTLYATQWTAKGGHATRPDSIALWVEKSSITSMSDYYVDAISGATPKSSGSQSYAWNLKDINGDTVLPGEYIIFVEGTLRWKNYVLYSGIITIGDIPDTISADPELIYEASDRQAALTNESPENAMINTVTISYSPSDNK